ncbi:hypothetical protein CVT26_009692 [Gymnopilus dilepis]|uniref:GST N-terminal domain-containing protein n=1 Tax=Gymnopilus dilepis TaxID=231916 RepID=A0A409YBL8_9AGAR|nr:hypothetical protein CVT26_009692 [Gymnopilus dilepis]
MTIIFYDIPSAAPENAWSPNTWKTRFALNYKGIPYKTEWVEYPDIEAHCIKLGIDATQKKADGKPLYTLPAIHDTSTGAYIADSLKIAEYLDKTYPDTPRLFPNNTVGLQVAFVEAFVSNLSALWQFALPAVNKILNPSSEAYFRRTREAMFGKTMEDLTPTGEAGAAEWAKFEKGLGNVNEWYNKNGGKGPFLLGETPSWGDLVVASYLIWLRIIFGAESRQWKDISSWHGGRWKTLLDSLKEYQSSWSGNLWRTRYHLNFKGIPYKTEWVEYPDIEPHCIKLGIPPTSTKADGTPAFTLPAIYDPATGVYISDSFRIAEYLDHTYPDTPPLLPQNTQALQAAFTEAFNANIAAVWDFIHPIIPSRLSPRSAAYFRRTREAAAGKNMEEFTPKGEEGVAQWARFKEGLERVDAWYAKSSGPFLLGDAPSWADFVVAARVGWCKNIFGEESWQWKDIASWHGGRWNALLDNLKQYRTVEA